MMDIQLIILSQYPTLFILSLLFFIANLCSRRRSVVKSFFRVLFFALSLSAGIVCCFWGLHEEYWTLADLIRPSGWSWLGLAILLVILLLRILYALHSAYYRRKLDKALRNAEKLRDEEVRRAREEGAAEERARSLAEASAPLPTLADDASPAAQTVPMPDEDASSPQA